MRVSLQKIYNSKLLAIIACSFLFGQLLSPIPLIQSSSEGDPDPELDSKLKKQSTEPPKDGWVYAHLEYEHDILEPNLFHMKLLAHPKSKVPDIVGAYAFTDVGVNIKVRGIDVPRALQNAEQLHRPHVWRKEERQRWNEAMSYVWNISDPTHTFRLHNLKKLDDRTIEADMEFLLGGQWHNFAIAMLHDEIARPLGDDAWDAGSREYGLINPNIPK